MRCAAVVRPYNGLTCPLKNRRRDTLVPPYEQVKDTYQKRRRGNAPPRSRSLNVLFQFDGLVGKGHILQIQQLCGQQPGEIAHHRRGQHEAVHIRGVGAVGL